MSKIYVNMRVKQSQKGNQYLGGYHKASSTGYFINKNKEGVNTLAAKKEDASKFLELGTLTAREGDYGPYEMLVAEGKVFTLSAAKNAGQPIVDKDGNPILDKDGNQIVGAPFVLVIKDDEPRS
jgi:hypothetical protein